MGCLQDRQHSPTPGVAAALHILQLSRLVARHVGLLTPKRRRKSDDLRRKPSVHGWAQNLEHFFVESTVFLRTTTPSRPRLRPKLIGGSARVSCGVAARTANGKERQFSETNPGEAGWVLSGFRLRPLPRPSEATLYLTERRERGAFRLGPGVRGRWICFCGDSEHGSFHLSGELEVVALLPGSSEGKWGPEIPTPVHLPQPAGQTAGPSP